MLPMNVNQALEVVEKVLLQRQLTTLERLILSQSWQGLDYNDMAKGSGYRSGYFKQVGSQLWHNLSETVGKRVTKKNLQLILKQYQPHASNSDNTQSDQSFTNIKITEKDCFPKIIETGNQYPSSPLGFNSPFYVNRPPIEKLVSNEIQKPGCVIRILGPKQMGKTSLLNKVIADATKIGYKIVYLDFQEADDNIFVSLDKFLRWLCANVSNQLNLTSKLAEYWDDDIGSKVSCKIYFEKYLLQHVDRPLILVFNEVNRVFEHPKICKDFFLMLRFWHEIAQQANIWRKIRFLAVYSTENSIDLKLLQSPFDFGLAINLPPFTLEQVKELAQRYGLSDLDDNTLQQLMSMLGGHPHLVSTAFYHLVTQNITLPELLETAPTQGGIYSQHLRNLLAIVRYDTELVSALRRVVTAEQNVELGATIAYKLESLGLIKLEGNQAIASCELYRLYFLKELKAENVVLATVGHIEETKFKAKAAV